MELEIDSNIKARLVWDGGSLYVPPEMGKPKEGQLAGTQHENLSELCCRVCYDSLGAKKSRSTDALHKHLLESTHGSVYEHPHFTVLLKGEGNTLSLWQGLANRPEMFLIPVQGDLRVTLNYRHLLDWDKQTRVAPQASLMCAREHFMHHASKVAGRIIQYKDDGCMLPAMKSEHVDPIFDEERFITVFLSGSRGMSHEQVRHRYNMSQRSSRFCDESDSAWVTHPLFTKFLADPKVPDNDKDYFSGTANNLVALSKEFYLDLVNRLQAYLIEQGVDEFNARKQARGTARGYLGNALLTELMFTASVKAWCDMLRQRCNPFADAEIRCMYGPVLQALKSSRYGDAFKEFEVVPSPDGLGTVLKK